jgi:hypothetical protein
MNQMWPFVTVPDNAIHASKVQLLSGGIGIFLVYVWENMGWVNDSVKIQETLEDYYGLIMYDWESRHSILSDFAPVP